jgi:hypothetical protein
VANFNVTESLLAFEFSVLFLASFTWHAIHEIYLVWLFIYTLFY